MQGQPESRIYTGPRERQRGVPARGLVAAVNVTKDYVTGATVVRALDRVSLTVDRGEFVSIMGPSGAGKSTLLHLLGGLDTATSGRVLLQGTDLAELSDARLTDFRRHQLGFVFQFFNLLPTMSAWENVAFPARLDGRSLRSARPRALELLDRVGLAEHATHRPAELSGGQLQRVAIARALMMEPSVIVADEPTGNLDTANGAAILRILRDCADEGTAVLMVTHDHDAAGTADRLVSMVDGRIVADAAVTDTPRR